MNRKHPAIQIIAKEYARDLVGEHEMGLRIMGEQFAGRVSQALSSAGYAIAPKEPTEAMQWAGGSALHDRDEDSVGIYKAMIASADE